MSSQSQSTAPSKNQQPQQCTTPVKHWVGVRLEDEDGNLVTDAPVRLKVNGQSSEVDFSVAVLDSGFFKTGKIYDAGQCDFSIPTSYDVEWWDKSGSAPATFPAEQNLILSDGDCAQSAASKAGFRYYHSVWDCTGNAGLKNDHPNANQQTPASTLRAPSQKTKTITKALDQSWTFVIRKRTPPKLTILVVDKDNKPLQGKAWVMTTAGKNGTTGADGKIEVEQLLLLSRTSDTLKITMKVAGTPPQPSPPSLREATDPPPYPRAIVPADFKDQMPPPDYTETIVEWTLKIGGVDSSETHAGALQRLANLGFPCSTQLGGQRLAKLETESLNAYKTYFKLNGTTWTDFKNDLRDRHDNA